MAIPSTAVWEVRSDGNNANGGLFVSSYGGTDYSQQATAQLTGTTGACTTATTTFTASENAFTPQMVGNGLYISSGTNATAGWYVITAYTSASQIDLDRTCSPIADGSAINYKVGGAIAHPSTIGAVVVAANVIHVQSGTYLVTSTSANVSGGRLNPTAHRTHWIGYGSTRNDGGTKPILQASGSYSGQPLITTNSTASHSFRNIEVNGASKATTNGFDFNPGGSSADCHDCYAHHCVNGFRMGPNCLAFKCKAISNSSNGFLDASGGAYPVYVDCFAKGNSNDGFQAASVGATYIRCVAKSNGRHGINGGTSMQCVAYGNTSNGIMTATNGARSVSNCIVYGNTGVGISIGTTNSEQLCFNNAHGANGSMTLPINSFGTIALSGDPFVDAANDDFGLNGTAGAGAACKATGVGTVSYPSSHPCGSGNYADIGAVQARPGGATVAAGWRGGIHE